MLTSSLILFAVALVILGVAAMSGLRRIDEILTVVDTRDGAQDDPVPASPAEG